jgi:glutamate--cysteine ligase
MALPQWPRDEVSIELADQQNLKIYRPTVQDGSFFLAGQKMDLILSNYDFSSGVPEILPRCKTPVIPPVRMGWHQRSKSRHFQILNQLLTDFCRTFGLDPWLFNSFSVTVPDITAENLKPLATSIDELIRQIRKKYSEYGITDEAYVFVKNDSGTYGLGVLPVSSGEEILQLNRKQREKLFAKKGSNQTNRFLLQEGVPTTDTYSGFPVEPVIYGVGAQAVGGFFRFHSEKNAFESLNAPGMDFSCLCLHKLSEPHETFFMHCDEKENLVTAAKFLVRFAALAAAREAL